MGYISNIGRPAMAELTFNMPPENGNADRALARKIANRFIGNSLVSPDKARSVAEQAREALHAELTTQAISDSEDNDSDGAPALRKAREGTTLNKDGQILLRLGQFNQLTAEEGQNKLANVLTVLVSSANARMKEASELNEAMEKVIAQLQAALNELEGATAGLEEKKNLLEATKQQLAALQSELAALEQEGVTADDPRHMALSEKIAAAKNAVSSASGAVATAEAEVLTLLDQSQALLNQHSDLIKQVTNISINAAGQLVMNRSIVTTAEKENLSAAERISLAMTQLMVVISESNLSKLKNDQALNRARMEATQESIKKKIDEANEQNSKAEKASKTCGLVSKILGGVLTAIGALSVIFGGAGAALMVIGIGMLLVDTVSEAVFGVSLSERMFAPLMEHIFMPLMNAISKVVCEIFDKTPLGLLLNAIDKATGANMMDSIHTATAAAATVAVIVAAAYVLKSAAKVVYDKFGKTMAQAVVKNVQGTMKAAAKNTPDILKKMGASAKNFNNQFTKALDDFSSSALKKFHLTQGQAESFLRMANDIVTFTNSTAQGAGGVIVAKADEQALEALAAVQVNSKVMEHLSKELQQMLERMKKDNDDLNEKSLMLSEMLQSTYETNMRISRRQKI
ncbi:type III secretion system translocon subunit SctE [Pantoea sp. B65]|uniref:type III secretion system translocon subunit SctE n=1 Tax=Pantoea sp. B65 TaxID=2813359 RepID=UPI0039B5E07F